MSQKAISIRQKPATCTKCGKHRIISFLCLFGMDEEPEEFRTKQLQLCKQCSKVYENRCRHGLCRQNYSERPRQSKEIRS